jgi:hypothetical protein
MSHMSFIMSIASAFGGAPLAAQEPSAGRSEWK